MDSFADWLAKRVWYAMLWFMRRPWVRDLQQFVPRFLPQATRQKVLEKMVSQDQFALRYGRKMLKYAFLVLLSSLSISACYEIFSWCYSNGIFIHPVTSRINPLFHP